MRRLATLGTEFARLYSSTGRPSIPPEKLLTSVAGVLLDPLRAPTDGAARYNLLFRWSVGLGVPTVLEKP
jgi:hypothetical protein